MQKLGQDIWARLGITRTEELNLCKWTLDTDLDQQRRKKQPPMRPQDQSRIHDSAACNSPHAGTPSGKGQYGYALYYIDYPCYSAQCPQWHSQPIAGR